MYTVSAFYFDGDTKLDTTNHESMGDFYGQRYRSRTDAEADCEILRDECNDTETRYEVLEG